MPTAFVARESQEVTLPARAGAGAAGS
jgi:hypothetical protein